MADNEDRSTEDLSEEASPFRVEEFRRKGQVAQSKEVTGLLGLLAVGITAYVMAPTLGAQMAEYMREVFRADLTARVNLKDNSILAATFMKALKIMIVVGLPICAAGFIVGIIGSVAQIGSIFSLEPLQPDFNKVNPLQGLQRFMSMTLVTEGLRLIFKMTIVIAIAYSLVKSQVLMSPLTVGSDLSAHLALYGHMTKVIFSGLMGILIVFAAIDFWMQKKEFSKKTRMTKQEAKQEYKEREGDPMIKARIRAVQREIARRRMMQAVKKADVIITNPTHIAIAIVYDKEKMAAPRVVAKGADFMAQKIKKIAADAGVPLVENVPLARTLFKTVKINQPIPRALYQAVAEVLAYVYRLRNRNL